MNTNASFSSILNRPASDVERPKVLPPGSYSWITRGIPRLDRSSQKKTPFAEFTLVPQAALDDVDQEALDAALTRKNGEKIQLQAKAQRLTFYLTEDAAWRLKEFLGHLGFDVEDTSEEAPSMEQMLNESANRTVGGFIAHKMSDDGSTYANITRTFAIE